jgi:hypothetical protein
MSYTAEQMYRDLYRKTTEQIIEMMIATGINPELGYYENESANLFDMGALHLMNRLSGSDFSRVMNRIGDIAVQKAEDSGEVPYWNYDRPAEDADDTISYCVIDPYDEIPIDNDEQARWYVTSAELV